jgi:hypothetical protein
VQIELSNAEQEILGQLLQNALATLEIEIRHTDHQEFREFLKHRRVVLNRLLARVPQPVGAAA